MNTGTIIGEEGTLSFSGSLNNATTGKISGYSIGTPSGTSFVSNGTFAPGMSPGTLNVSGQMKLTDGILEVDINGLTEGTEYDQLVYTGTTAVNLTGAIAVNLSFEASVGDEFIIFKSPSAALSSSLTPPVFVEYNGNHYYFGVSNEANQVKLTIIQKILAVSEAGFAKAQIYPNPVKDFLNYKTNGNLLGYDVMNTSGQKILSGKFSSNEGKIDLNSLTSGIYILILKYTDHTENHKLIKK